MKTVLILAHQCHPFERRESTMGAQRAYQFAKWLPDFGWRVEVLCCPNMPDQIDPVHIGLSSITPVPPDADSGLIDRWWTSLEETTSPISKLCRRALTVALFAKGDWSRPWRSPATEAALARVAAGCRGELPPIKVVLGEHGPDAGLWAARDVAQASSLPWIADFRDSILASWQAGTQRSIASVGVRRMLRGVRATVNMNPYWSEIDRRLSGAPGFVIPNGYDPDGTPRSEDRFDKFTAVVFGSVRQSHRTDVLIDCVAHMRRSHGITAGTFELLYFGLHGEKLSKDARARGIEDLFRSGGFVSRPELLRTVARAHAVVVPTIDPEIEREPLFVRGVVHGKMPEVLPLGTPIIFLPGDRGYADEILDRTNAGVVARTEEDLTAVLGDWFDCWRSGRAHGPAPNQKEVERFSRREGARRLAGVLDGISVVGMVPTDRAGSKGPASCGL